jgi:hypothetical protein
MGMMGRRHGPFPTLVRPEDICRRKRLILRELSPKDCRSLTDASHSEGPAPADENSLRQALDSRLAQDSP